MGSGTTSGIRRFIKYLMQGSTGTSAPPKPLDISKFQGLSLEQIESRLRNLDHEELFILDKDGNLVKAYTGGSSSVGFEKSDRFEFNGATVTHSHPVEGFDFGGTLSPADVKNLARSKWKEIRATARGHGEMNYIVRKKTGARGGPLLKKIRDDDAKLTASIKRIYKESYNYAKKQGKTSEQAMHTAAQKATGYVDQYWRDTLPKYGYEYIKRKREYKYNR